MSTADNAAGLESAIDEGELVEAPTSMKVLAPFLALGAAWAVQKALETVYVKVTGTRPPHAGDPDASMRRILMWAAATAAAVAVVNVAIDRATAPRRMD